MQQDLAQQDVQTGNVQVAVAMAGDRIGLPVMFRKDELTGRVFALLPTIPGDKTTYSSCVCHERGGVVTNVNVYNALVSSTSASPTEYRELMEELKRMYAGNHLMGYVCYNQWFNRTRGMNVMKLYGLLE
jgi:hypothetical protein